MLLFRSLALGLLGACFWLLATRPATVIVRQPIEVPNLSGIRGVPQLQGPSVVDVAPNIEAARLPSLIQLGAGERVVAIDDLRVANDLEAGRVLAAMVTAPQRFIDLDVEGPRGERRVLVLLH
jgi:hypothetical protein